jgi:hypothetical protein
MATESASSANGNKASSANVIDQTGTESSNSTSADVSNQVRKRKGKTPIQAYTLPCEFELLAQFPAFEC